MSEEALRRHDILKNWDLRSVSFTSKPRVEPSFLTCSDWLVMNVLALDERLVIVDETDIEFANRMRELGMKPVFCQCSLRHVNSIGKASHCATVDLVCLGARIIHRSLQM